MFSRFFKNYTDEKNGNSNLVSYRTAMSFSSNSYDDLAEIGYKKNVIVYRCIQLISRALASVEWNLQDGDNVIHDHEILDLMNKPNATQYKTTFIEEAVSYLLLSGNCYIMAEKASDSSPKNLYLLRPDRVKVIPGPSGFPLAYQYQVANNKRVFEVDQETGRSDILHIKLFNPLDDWYGMSPIEAAIGSINQHNSIAQQNT